jgi:hypothetical protein
VDDVQERGVNALNLDAHFHAYEKFLVAGYSLAAADY